MAEAQIQLDGTLLLADPSLRDGIFDRSVILLADHSAEDGAIGLILNHPSGHDVGHFLKDEAFEPLAGIPVHLGGPVSREQLSFSALWWEKGLRFELRIPAEDAIERHKQPGTIVRAFVGYSGWSAGQLENELRRQSWFTMRPDASLLQHQHDSGLWRALLRGVSPYHHIISEAPPHPENN